MRWHTSGDRLVFWSKCSSVYSTICLIRSGASSAFSRRWPDLLVGQADRRLDRVDVVDAEGQDVLVGDRVDDRVGVQLVAEGLLGRAQLRVAAGAGVGGEDRRPGEAEQVVAAERLGDRRVHVAELGAVALVEDDDDVAVVDRVALVGGDEGRELLDGRDDDPSRSGPRAAA
jgi:hypothetical protein